MDRRALRGRYFGLLMAALVAAVLFYELSAGAAEEQFTIYFEDSTLPLKAESVNRTIYLPLTDIVRHLAIPYTDAIALEAFTIRSQNSVVVLTRNSRLISIN